MSFWHSKYSNYKHLTTLDIFALLVVHIYYFLFSTTKKYLHSSNTNIFLNNFFLPCSTLIVLLCVLAFIKKAKTNKNTFKSLFCFHQSGKFYIKGYKLKSLQKLGRWYKWESRPSIDQWGEWICEDCWVKTRRTTSKVGTCYLALANF